MGIGSIAYREQELLYARLVIAVNAVQSYIQWHAQMMLACFVPVSCFPREHRTLIWRLRKCLVWSGVVTVDT